MRRTLVISEEFGLWRAEASNGAHGSGGTPDIAIRNLVISAGVPGALEMLDELEMRGGARPEEIFELVIPKQEGRPDVPASTVR